MNEPKSSEFLTDDENDEIQNAIKQAALDHLNARDAETALSHYTIDAIVITNGHWFESYKSFEKDVREFFSSLREVKLANWDKIRIKVVSSKICVFSGLVHWSSVDKTGEVLSLKGTWSAVYALEEGQWKILLRHESYEENNDQ
jgi:ketosteroid isomerase-like protein